MGVSSRRKGFTLIEMAMTIVVLGIAVITIMSMFIESSKQSVVCEVTAVATGLAEGKMEEVLRNSFTNVNSQATTAFSSPFEAYSSSVVVDYVNGSDFSHSGSNTEYKKVTVTVSHSAISNVVLDTIVSNYQN